MSKLFGSAALAIALAACTTDAPAPLVRETVPARVIVVQNAPVESLRAFTGTVRSANVSPLAAKVMGNVLRVHVREGDRVRAGQLLVEIDAQSAVAQANAATSALTAAEAHAALAEATFRRFDALRARGSASAQEFDDAAARRDAAVAEVQRARAMSAQAKTFLDDASVRAPIDGIVTARFIDPGAQAAPGMPLLTIENAGAFRVETFVPEEMNVRVGDRVRLDDAIEARVARVQPAIDAVTRTSLVQIELASSPGERIAGSQTPQRDTNAAIPFRSGQYVRVTIPTGRRDAIRVPQTAIVRRGTLTNVFVVGAADVARMRLITLGEDNEVLSGLSAGERIVADAANVRDGVRVS
jgi:membrane fusion protein (multidrug efflux system)